MEIIDFCHNFPCFGTWLKKNNKSLLRELKKRKPTITVPNHTSVLKLVKKDLGVAMVPSYLIQDELASGELVSVFPDALPTKVVTDLAFPLHKNFSVLERKFVDLLRENLKSGTTI